MSWTQVCDLPFTDYEPNLALDASGFKNNAQIIGNISTANRYVAFQQPGDRLVIPVKDDSLQRFLGVRVDTYIKPEGAVGYLGKSYFPHRYNIVEGWMSFAFVIDADGKLVGSIYDGQDWITVTSGDTVVELNKWSQVSFEYDGISIGRLAINGTQVGANINMPMNMPQPYKNITIGHWPNGDDRYTFFGKISHLRIYRRDYEDYSRDAETMLFCRRTMSPRQASAIREIQAIIGTMDLETRESMLKCAKEKAERMREFLRALRDSNRGNINAQGRLGDELQAAWCCAFDPAKAKSIMLEYLRSQAGDPGSEERIRFEKLVDEFMDIMKMCDRKDPPFDRIKELSLIIFPELSYAEAEFNQITQSI